MSTRRHVCDDATTTTCNIGFAGTGDDEAQDSRYDLVRKLAQLSFPLL
jgi:hypothetical protein